MAKFAGDPELQALIKKVQDKMGSMAGAGMSMPGMPAGMDKVLSDPEIVKALQDPKMMKAMVELQTGGPSAMKKYESDPDFMRLLEKIQAAMAGASGPGASAGGGSDDSTDGMGFTQSKAGARSGSGKPRQVGKKVGRRQVGRDPWCIQNRGKTYTSASVWFWRQRGSSFNKSKQLQPSLGAAHI